MGKLFRIGASALVIAALCTPCEAQRFPSLPKIPGIPRDLSDLKVFIPLVDIFRPDNKSCAAVAVASGAVASSVFRDDRDAGAIGAIAGGLICTSVKLKGVKPKDTGEVADVAGQMMNDRGAQRRTVTTASGNTYDISASETRDQRQEQKVNLLEDVETPEDGSQVVAGLYQVNVKNTLNVRAAPNTESKITGIFRSNEYIQVLSIAPNGEWALIGSKGIGVGYVSLKYLTKAPSGITLNMAVQPSQPPKPKPNTGKAPRGSGQVQTQASASTEPPKIRQQKVVMVSQCKSMQIGKNSQTQCSRADGSFGWS